MWQSVSDGREDVRGTGVKLIIAAFETDGLSFSVPAHKHLAAMKFDGKMYADSGAGDTKGDSSSGKRVNDHLLQIDGQVNGKLEESEDFKVSDDGKTRWTIVTRSAA